MENAKSEQETILYKGACFSMHYGIPSIKKILKEAKQNKNFIYKRGKRIIKFMPPIKRENKQGAIILEEIMIQGFFILKNYLLKDQEKNRLFLKVKLWSFATLFKPLEDGL